MTTPDGQGAIGSTGYRLTPQEISAASVSVDQTANQIHNQLAALQSYVMNLENVWHGVAQQTFQLLMHDYSTFSTMLHQALTGIASGLRGNYVNYVDSEQANINSLQVVHADLPSARF